MGDSHYEIYTRFLEETSESELEIGSFAFALSHFFIDFPKKMRVTQAFNIIYKFAHRTPGWILTSNSRHQRVLRRVKS